MSDQQGIKVKRRRGFTVVYNDLLPAEGKLSARAWGVFVYLIGRPDGWETRVSHLQTVFSEGRDALYTALRELVAAELMTKETYLHEGLRRTRYVLDADAPGTDSQDSGTPDAAGPGPESQDAENPAPEIPGQVTTEGTSTEGAKTEGAKDGPRKRGTRLPDDWEPDDALKQWFREQEFATWINPVLETQQFRDYWLGVSGQRGTKLDWPATWRMWMRNAAKRVGYSGPANRDTATGSMAADLSGRTA